MVRFVGRVSELGLLAAQYAAAVATGLRCVLAEGPPGIGKTTLLDWFLGGLVEGDLPPGTPKPTIVRVEAVYGARTHDLDLADRLLDQLTRVPKTGAAAGAPVPAARPAGAGNGPAAMAAMAAPGLGRHHGPRLPAVAAPAAPSGRDIDIDGMRATGTFEADLPDVAAGAVAERIRETGELLTRAAELCCAAGPMVLRIDDVHWCDAPSLRAIGHLLLHGGRLPLLVLIAGRPHDSPWLDGVRRRAAVAGLALDLSGFGETELADLCVARGFPPPPPRRLRYLVKATEGNPLWISKLLTADGEERWEGISQSAVSAPRAPESLASLVQRDLAACPPEGRALAAVVAVLGRSGGLTDIATLAGITEPARALAQAVRHDLVGTVGAPPALRVVPPHAVVRATIYHAVDLEERSALHLAVAAASADRATALEHRAAAALTPDSELAGELIKLAESESASGRYAWAADHLLLAASITPDRAQARSLRLDAAMSFLQAGERAEATAALAADDGADGQSTDGGNQVDGSPRQLYVRAHLDLLANRAEQGVLGFMASWEAARARGDTETAAQSAAGVAQAYILAGFNNAAQTWARRAFDETGAPSPMRAQGLALAASALTAATGDGARALAELAAGERLLDPTPHTHMTIRVGRGAVRLWSGDLEGAVADLHPETYTPQDPLHQRFMGMIHYTEAAFRSGRWEESLACGRDSITLAESAGHLWGLPVVHATAALVPAARGDAATVGRMLARAAEYDVEGVASICGYRTTTAAHLAAALDDPDGVVEACSRVAALANPAGARPPGVFEWRHLYIEALSRLRRFAEAEAELASLDADARTRGSAVTLALVARAHGVLLTGQRRHDEAVALFERSAAESDALGMPFPAAQARLRAAEVHRRRRRNAKAAAELTAALDVFDALGAATYSRRCRELIAALRGRAAVRTAPVATHPGDAPPITRVAAAAAVGSGDARASPGPAAGGAGGRPLTDREQALLTRILRGDDFESIARELYMSKGHAENVARELYRMHGVTSRAELAGIYLGLRGSSDPPLFPLPTSPPRRDEAAEPRPAPPPADSPGGAPGR
ncbi:MULTISPECIES: AAA family ATPase [Pseudofrankia]|uniref:AAA family ATPase n=1 Tax=Pseudofrankia TaxID=2994363 RepID=UPI000234BF91|nr:MULTISPECIES: AAA family ATPase [Pseudofrankia]OHV29959.1 LuxR family transcriptional regulator [Pseudofrankia sp. EUN1h]